MTERKLPEGWEWKRLGDLTRFIYGCPFDSTKFNTEGHGIPIIRIRNLIDNSTETYYDGDYDEMYVVKDNDVLIGMDGEFNIVRWHGRKAVLNQRVCKIEIENKSVLSDYILRVLVQILKRIEDTTPSVTVKHLSAKQLNAIEIPLPSLSTQKKIVSILEQAERAKRLRARADEMTDRLLQSVFIGMFYKGNPDYYRWKLASIHELASQEKGSMRTGPFGSNLRHSEFVDSGIAVLGIDNVVNNRFQWVQRRYITKEKYEKLECYTVYPNDVLISIMATIGKSCVVPDNIPLSISTKHLAVITCDASKCNPQFLSHSIIYHPEIRRQILKANIGAIMEGLNLRIIKNLKIPLPPLPLQQKFARTVEKIEATRERQKRSKQEIDDLFDALMQKAFTGELTS